MKFIKNIKEKITPKNLTKTTTKFVANTVKDIGGGIIEGVDEAVNGDNIKEIRAEQKEIKAQQNAAIKIKKEELKKENSLEMKIWFIGITISVVYGLYSLFNCNFIGKCFEESFNPLIIISILLICFIYSLTKIIGRL